MEVATQSPESVMGFLKKFGPSLLFIGETMLAAFTPSFQGMIGHHPIVSSVLVGVQAVLGHLMPSPLKGGSNGQ